MYRLLLLSSIIFTAGCGLLDPGCDLVLLPGIRVAVVDSISGQPLPPDEVTVVVVDGSYQDTAVAQPEGGFAAVFDRPGTYDVRVTAPGYSTWTHDDVRVEAPDGCIDRTVDLVARMQPTE